MLPTQDRIEHLADRIERAYALRRPGWDRGCSSNGVWTAAALCLWQAHVEDPSLPLDSELFVASQPITGSLGDPWSELAQPEARRRYRVQVRHIILRLRRELSREVRRAERAIAGGGRLLAASLSRDGRLSPLGCYIAAYRSGRNDLANLFAGAAADQHRACPLYQSACSTLLPPDQYPLGSHAATKDWPGLIRNGKKTILMN